MSQSCLSYSYVSRKPLVINYPEVPMIDRHTTFMTLVLTVIVISTVIARQAFWMY